MRNDDQTAPVVLAAIRRDQYVFVLREARRHASALGAHLVICHVLQEPMPVEVARREVRARAAATLDVAPRDLDVLICVGDPATEVLRAARERGAELVVVGCPRHGRLVNLVRRCTLDRVLHETRVPLLVARDSPESNVLVVATDLADPRFPVLRAAARESQAFHTNVIALHAIEAWPLRGTGVDASWLARLPFRYQVWARRARDQLDFAIRRAHFVAEPQVVFGGTNRTIIEAARRSGASLIVIGSHERSLGARLAARAVTRPVVRRAPCSVFVVPLAATPSA